MSEIDKDIDAALANVAVTPAVYRVSGASWRTGFQLFCDGKPKVEIVNEAARILASSVGQRLDPTYSKHTVHTNSRDDLRATVYNHVISHLVWFLSSYQKTKNNKLTSLYRWYMQFAQRYNTNSENQKALNEDLYSIYKWMKPHDDRVVFVSDPKNIDSALAILEAIKRKYEAKGMKL